MNVCFFYHQLCFCLLGQCSGCPCVALELDDKHKAPGEKPSRRHPPIISPVIKHENVGRIAPSKGVNLDMRSFNDEEENQFGGELSTVWRGDTLATDLDPKRVSWHPPPEVVINDCQQQFRHVTRNVLWAPRGFARDSCPDERGDKKKNIATGFFLTMLTYASESFPPFFAQSMATKEREMKTKDQQHLLGLLLIFRGFL